LNLSDGTKMNWKTLIDERDILSARLLGEFCPFSVHRYSPVDGKPQSELESSTFSRIFRTKKL